MPKKRTTRSVVRPAGRALLPQPKATKAAQAGGDEHRGEGHTESYDDLLDHEKPFYDALKPVFDRLDAGGDVVDELANVQAAMQQAVPVAIMRCFDDVAHLCRGWEAEAREWLQTGAEAAAQHYAAAWIGAFAASGETGKGNWSDQRLRDISVTEGTTARYALAELFQALWDILREVILGRVRGVA